ncbi:hypothetical protein DSO57_1010942 [Entomophthora muscae]|uniref:Uncharacterized protein n=2 Tax=Entomophthora muscae TaxID=34485 RepID=A0ACC2SJN5_9FUNG|nr:hypothetical protein DSO57_1010076 [Entomophthora muscae]KAJ9073962.1 hypothetical protein DSO57_1010942 [Entomophthora muscae]
MYQPPLKPLRTKTYLPNVTRSRNKLTASQFKVLESLYHQNSNPPLALRQKLSLQLNLTQRSIQIWFQNRRAKTHRSSEAKTSPSPAAERVLSEYWMTTMSHVRYLHY